MVDYGERHVGSMYRSGIWGAMPPTSMNQIAPNNLPDMGMRELKYCVYRDANNREMWRPLCSPRLHVRIMRSRYSYISSTVQIDQGGQLTMELPAATSEDQRSLYSLLREDGSNRMVNGLSTCYAA